MVYTKFLISDDVSADWRCGAARNTFDKAYSECVASCREFSTFYLANGEGPCATIPGFAQD